ncbi:MAG: hypothetical protein AAF405_02165 [Pseudomonadota bacterium]
MSSKGRGELKLIDSRYWRGPAGVIALCAGVLLVSGCGGGGGTTGFSSERLPDKLPLSDWGSDSKNAAVETAEPAIASNDGRASSCPQVVAWPNEKLKTVYQRGHDGDANFIVYRGELTKLSRECRSYGGRVVVKYGYAGRVLLGPKGYPGSYSLPVSVKATDAYKAQIGQDRMSVRVTVPGDQTVGYFSMVREISLPVRTGTRLEDYKIFVALK